MVDKLNGVSKYWWLYLIVGILVTILGIMFFANLGFALTTVTILSGIYFIVAGIGGAITAIVDRKLIPLWGLTLALQIIVAIAGVMILARPSFALSFMWILCGIGFMFNGIALIVSSFGLKAFKVGASWIAMLVLGILVVIASFIIMAHPVVGLTVVAICAAMSCLFFGISNIVLAIQLKSGD